MTTPIRLAFEAALGAHSKDIAIELVRLSELLHIDVWADVLGVEMYARPGDDIERVWKRWHGYRERDQTATAAAVDLLEALQHRPQ